MRFVRLRSGWEALAMIEGIDLDHVAVAVEQWRDAWPRYRRDLGGEWVAGGDSYGFASAQLRYANGMKVEVLAPHAVDKNDFLRRFLDRNGPGAHHLTFKVKDIEAALAAAEEAGYRPVNVDLSEEEWKEGFLHPKDAPGVVVQLAQSSGSWDSPPPADLPGPRTEMPATLVHITHVVADLSDGLRLFNQLLGGRATAHGTDSTATWVDLAWPGPGRVRVAAPLSGTSPLVDFLHGRRGAVHHIAFSHPSNDGAERISPEDNHGVRLVVASGTQAFQSSFDGYAD